MLSLPYSTVPRPGALMAGAAIMMINPVPAVAGTGDDQTGELSQETSTRRTFKPDDFERFAPRSALDMAQQIPGFSIQSGGGARGLGQADTNVLINGQRISGKSNGPVEALRRIPSKDVVQLELVDGASLDIGGLTGQVLNVITRSTGGISGQFRYSAEWRSFGVPFRWGDGQVSFAGGGANSEWTLSFENDAGRRGNEGTERVFAADGTLIDIRDEKSRFDSDRPSLSGSYTRNAANGNTLNLTGQVQGFIFRQSEISERSGAVAPTERLRDFQSSEDEYNFELGVDYSFAFGPGRLKLIGYHRYEDSPTVSLVTTSFADNRPITGSRFTRDADEGETIGRAEYTFAGLGGDLQWALEGVKNSLEIDSQFEETDEFGDFQPVEFDGASARVEEDRAETSITYSRPLAANLQLQLSLGGEYSRISQSGQSGLTRTFYRPKGFASFDWNANQSLNLSGRVAREVGQLNFFDFIASANLDQDRVNVTNANLVPPQSWVVEIEATKSLDELGSINLRAFHENISDIVDQIPIEGGGEAPGNLDSATRAGIAGEVTLLFDSLGARGLRFDGEFEIAESEVLDPLLGTPREISNFRWLLLDLGIRQDFFGSPWAMGASYRLGDRRASVRVDEVALATDRPGFARVFVEHKDLAGLTARLRIGNLINQRDNLDRTIFIDRAAGLIDLVEERRRVFGVVYSFDIEGSF